MRVEMQNDRVTIYVGDSADLDLPVNSVDAIVCDPPSGIAFMGKSWDKDHGGRDAWIEWLARTIAPAFDALKPGGHGLFWALPRTSHWAAMALELAGFEIRDRISAAFGSGFPKSLSVSKAIDKHLGAGKPLGGPVTHEAVAWDGWGTALKPAIEDWWLVRKPLIGTVADNVLTYGTGGLNIDASRIGWESDRPADRSEGAPRRSDNPIYGTANETINPQHASGRWPAHFILSHDDGCEVVGQTVEDRPMLEHTGRTGATYGAGLEGSRAVGSESYRCAPGCPVALLDAQSGDRPSGSRKQGVRGGLGYESTSTGDGGPALTASSGGASRFFYCAKPSKSETEAGLDDLPGKRKNTHPTKKSVALMRYLIRLITPPGGVVLDPFAGSGTTGIAALAEGMRFIGCEQGGDGEEYVPILLGRIGHALQRHG